MDSQLLVQFLWALKGVECLWEKDCLEELDNRIKITNLPKECTVSIYSLNGVLVRQYVRSNDPSTSLDWDLKNHKNVPIAGGVYIIHIDVPEVGEKILKWFGVMRPIDLDNF